MQNNKLFVSVDMDEWYLARWATGSKNALWNSPEEVFRDLYKSDRPKGEIYEPTYKILKLFDKLNFRSTFFFTGYIASFYPDLVKTISKEGHEIASHNYYHLDYEYETEKKFTIDLKASKQLLEDLTGKKTIGYRSPNSSLPKNLVSILENEGFQYDSSVTPTRRIFGKFGEFTKAPRFPYHPSYNDIAKTGNTELWEFPWATFPILKLPAGSGIMHRLAGNMYNNIAIRNSLNKGTTSYYFHPYELSKLDFSFRKNLKIKLFLRNTGETYYSKLKHFLNKHKDILINGEELLKELNGD